MVMVFNDLVDSRSVQVVLTLLVLAFVNVVGRMIIERLIRRVVRSDSYESQIDERKRENTIITVFNTTLTLLLVIIALCVVLAIMHVNIAALITGAGVFGVVFGLGAQSTIKNYLAGIYILSENQYRVGDVITLSGGSVGQPGVSGVVEEITLRVTKLRDQDGTLNIIANGDAAVITNRTFNYSNVIIDLTVQYDSDLDVVEKVINDNGKRMQQEEKWKALVVEPMQFLRIEDFTQAGVLIRVSGKVTPGAQWDVGGDFRRRLKTAFDKKDITFAVPERIIHHEKDA